jgi:hypothetical protein
MKLEIVPVVSKPDVAITFTDRELRVFRAIIGGVNGGVAYRSSSTICKQNATAEESDSLTSELHKVLQKHLGY